MSISCFEHREIDYGLPSTTAECHLGVRNIGGLEFRAYLCTLDGRLSTRAQYALVVCRSCGHSIYEFPHRRDAWYMMPEVVDHHLSCDGSAG